MLQAMEKEMMKPQPDMGTLRSLIAMATDEVGVEIGTDTVARCKESLEEAELQVRIYSVPRDHHLLGRIFGYTTQPHSHTCCPQPFLPPPRPSFPR